MLTEAKQGGRCLFAKLSCKYHLIIRLPTVKKNHIAYSERKYIFIK